jgi:hypothetical protein
MVDDKTGQVTRTILRTTQGLWLVESRAQEAQAEFMQSRLGPAMAAGGVTATPTVTWARLLAHQNPGL